MISLSSRPVRVKKKRVRVSQQIVECRENISNQFSQQGEREIEAMFGRFSRILVVDDSATMRTLVTAMLKRLGYENIHQACDGRSALSMLTQTSFSLVISDWNMTPMNGLELLQELRKSAPSRPVPFIMMTSHAVKFAAIARCDGAIHYLIKPFSVDQLIGKVFHATNGVAA